MDLPATRPAMDGCLPGRTAMASIGSQCSSGCGSPASTRLESSWGNPRHRWSRSFSWRCATASSWRGEASPPSLAAELDFQIVDHPLHPRDFPGDAHRDAKIPLIVNEAVQGNDTIFDGDADMFIGKIWIGPHG